MTLPGILLREPRPGDLGWIISRQSVLYAEEYGWNGEYETLVSEIVGKFRPAPGERCWIAEMNGEPVGAIFVVRADDTTAELRMLHVEAFARGHGLGRLLVDTAIIYARDAGYKRLTLWTNDVLVAARRIYETTDFTLTKEEKHHSFGKDLIGQTWSLDL